MKRRRIVVAMHSGLMPPESSEGMTAAELHPVKQEYDVCVTLEELGHDVLRVGVDDELAPLRRALKEHQPHVVFNLLTHFHDVVVMDSAVVSWLELIKQPYTGCNPRGLLVASDKALSKKIMAYHRIPAPHFMTVPLGRPVGRIPKNLRFPLFVKSKSEHASVGISEASIVRDPEALADRVEYMHRTVGTGVICEEYIEGRELSIPVMGNRRIEVGPVWEVFMDDLRKGAPRIFTSRVKWDLEYQERIGLRSGPAELDDADQRRIARLAKRIYKALGLSGYARIDLRLDADGKAWILEANPNNDLSFGEDFAEGFSRRDYSYPKLLQRIVNLGLRYEAPWKS